MSDSKIAGSRWFKCVTALLLAYGSVLSVAGFVIGRFCEGGLQDFRQRWFEIHHFCRGINPFDVMTGGAAGIEGVPYMYIGGYPPWSYLMGCIMIPPLRYDIALAVFTLFQLAALLGMLWLLCRMAGGIYESKWVMAFFAGLFLAMPGLATDLKWGNYTVIALFLLYACMVLCESRKRGVHYAASVLFALAFIKPQMAALFGVMLLLKGLWRVWLPAGVLVAVAGVAASIRLGASPIFLLSQLFASTVDYASRYDYARYYNHGLLDVLKLAGVGIDLIVKLGFVLGVVGTGWLVRRYMRSVPLMTLAAVPATFVTLWGYNQKYDWLVISFLLSAFGMYAFETERESVGRNICLFALLVVLTLVFTLKLAWFGYTVNCFIQFGLRLLWIAALLYLLEGQRKCDAMRRDMAAT